MYECASSFKCEIKINWSVQYQKETKTDNKFPNVSGLLNNIYYPQSMAIALKVIVPMHNGPGQMS